MSFSPILSTARRFLFADIELTIGGFTINLELDVTRKTRIHPRSRAQLPAVVPVVPSPTEQEGSTPESPVSEQGSSASAKRGVVFLPTAEEIERSRQRIGFDTGSPRK